MMEDNLLNEIEKLAQLGSWKADLSNNITYWSDQTYRIYGYEPGEITPDYALFLSHVHPEDRELLQRSIDDALINLEVLESNFRIIDKKGNVKYIYAKILIKRNSGHKPIHLTGFNLDITASALANVKIKRSTDFANAILNTLSSHVAVIDETGIIQMVNKSWNDFSINNAVFTLELTGIGSNYFDVCKKAIVSDDLIAEEALEGIMGVFKNELKFFEIEYPCHSPDEERWFILRATKLENSRNEVVLDHHNITEKKNAASSLKKALDNQEHLNKELEQFSYSVSHDLQEPLRMISSFLNLLKLEAGDQLSPEAHEYIHFAVDGAERMRELIHALLQYSRVGRHKDDFVQIDLHETLQFTTRVLQNEIENTKAVIKIPKLPVIYASKTLMPQLFMNLIGNALKYNNETNPEIEIGFEEQPDDWCFYIKDNGVGIAGEYLEKIFQVFQKAHHNQKYPGSGLGLAICKQIVEKHNGKIWVNSQPGEGSIFYFTIKKRQSDS